MKTTDFKLIKDFPLMSDIEALAEVTITTGLLWLKKTERVKIFKRNYGWFFVDGGKELSNFSITKLERCYRAKQLLNACKVKV